MQYAPIFLFLIIMLLAYWVTMKSIIVPPKNSSSSNVDFIPSLNFKGYKRGYVFKKGNLGIGYYKDSK